MERVLFNLHRQMCTSAMRRTSNRSRSFGEYCLLVLAVCGFGVLLLMHISFVYTGTLRNIPLTCLTSVPGFSTKVDVTHISLSDSNISSAFTTNSSECEEQTCLIHEHPTRGILLSHSKIKGYLLLPTRIAIEKQLVTQYVDISKLDGKCFGEPFLQKIIFTLIGPDTAMLNWLLAAFNGEGYVYNPRSKRLQDLNDNGRIFKSFTLGDPLTLSTSDEQVSWNKQALAKIGVVLKTSFLFFITSTMVSFTLRETQQRMLDFTRQLQARVRSRRPVLNLVTTHLADSLVFCPVMVGMIFFLIEFYQGDKAMAFMVLSVVWLFEVFSIIR